MNSIHKYPRTYHIEGSGIQRGDEDLAVVPLREFAGRHLVVEEKMDGANCAVSFDSDGQLLVFAVMADQATDTAGARAGVERMATALAGCGCG